MIWKETNSKAERRAQIKSYVIERFKKIYPFISENDTVLFRLNDEEIMKVVSLGGTHFDDLVMNYKSPNDSDDGDLYTIDDFDTPEKLFEAMLEETKRT